MRAYPKGLRISIFRNIGLSSDEMLQALRVIIPSDLQPEFDRYVEQLPDLSEEEARCIGHHEGFDWLIYWGVYAAALIVGGDTHEYSISVEQTLQLEEKLFPNGAPDHASVQPHISRYDEVLAAILIRNHRDGVHWSTGLE